MNTCEICGRSLRAGNDTGRCWAHREVKPLEYDPDPPPPVLSPEEDAKRVDRLYAALATAKWRAAHPDANRRYRQSPAGKAARKRYNSKPEVKARHAKRVKAWRENLTLDEKRVINDKRNARLAKQRAAETPEEREARLAKKRAKRRAAIAAETPEQRRARLDRHNRQQKKRYHAAKGR